MRYADHTSNLATPVGPGPRNLLVDGVRIGDREAVLLEVSRSFWPKRGPKFMDQKSIEQSLKLILEAVDIGEDEGLGNSLHSAGSIEI